MATHLVSYSEIDTYRQCPFKHQLSYKERWTEPQQSPALAKGSLMHLVLETHYNMVKAWQKDQITDAELPLFIMREVGPLLYDTATGESLGEVAELVEWMYKGYIERYGYDDPWLIEEVEHAAELWLPNDKGNRSNVRIKMKMDLLTVWKGKLWLVDHKTGRTLPKEKDLDLDVQFKLYTWGMRKLGYPVHGAIYNAIRTQRNVSAMALDDRFQRLAMSFTDQEVDAVARDFFRDAKVAYRELAALPKGEDAPRHYNTDTCGWKCSFTEPCLAGIKGVSTREFLEIKGFRQSFERH